jgi:hypothetical protein
MKAKVVGNSKYGKWKEKEAAFEASGAEFFVQ